jgi:uncharacterized protein YqkB
LAERMSNERTCPRGCVDTDGCGCEWNAKQDALALARLVKERECVCGEINARHCPIHQDVANV